MDLTQALATFLHVLVFAYWLGGDLGVFYLSRTVTNRQASVADRQLAVNRLLQLDLAPRTALILTLPTGLLLTHLMGWWRLPTSNLVSVWALSLVWLVLVWWLHLAHQEWLRKLDLAIRLAVLATLIALAALANVPVFLKIKIALLAAALVLGLIVRHCLKPLGPGLAALASGDLQSANPLIEGSIGRSRLPVLGIWAVISLAAFMGLWKLV